MLINEDDKRFLELLSKIPVRLNNVRPCDKFSELEADELSSILALKDIVTMDEACKKLRPVYQNYKEGSGKRRMPDLVIRGIYYIIFREMSLMLEQDKKLIPQKRNMLDEEGKLRKRILPKCTNKVYQILGEKNSKPQERLGITPLKDFTILNYEPLGLHVPYLKDRLFRELFVNVIYQADYAMFIDLTGEDSILGDIYYCDREVICCRDSVSANFYYALQLKYNEFCKRAENMLKNMSGNTRENISSYQEEVEKANKRSYEALGDYEKMASDKNTVLTYPLKGENIDLDLAVMYLVVQLDKYAYRLEDTLQEQMMQILQYQMRLLKNRLDKTIISWGSTEDILDKIKDGNVRFSYLKKEKKSIQLSYIPELSNSKARKITYYENIKDTIKRETDSLCIDLRIDGCSEDECQKKIKIYKKNKETRVKKGFLFYDFNVRKDTGEAEKFAQFVHKNDCLWAFVCDRQERYWIERLKENKVSMIEINKDNVYAKYIQSIGLHDVIIITNVDIKDIIHNRLKTILCAFDIKDNILNTLVTIHNGQTEQEFDGDEDERT